ncbi:MAG: hypothetical protein KAV83_04830 [Desulfobacterales bacterium]|nr:hypothetical protein [Desulfobacterales bacterium]
MTKVEITQAIIEILQRPGTSEAQANLAYAAFLIIMKSRYIIPEPEERRKEVNTR